MTQTYQWQNFHRLWYSGVQRCSSIIIIIIIIIPFQCLSFSGRGFLAQTGSLQAYAPVPAHRLSDATTGLGAKCMAWRLRCWLQNPTPNLLSRGFKVGMFQNWRVFQFWDRKFKVQLFEMSTWEVRPFLNFVFVWPWDAFRDHPATSNNLWRDWLRLFTKVKSKGVSSRWNLWIFFQFTRSCLVTILELSHLGPVLCSKGPRLEELSQWLDMLDVMLWIPSTWDCNSHHLGSWEREKNFIQKIYNSTASKSFLNCPIAWYLGHLGV